MLILALQSAYAVASLGFGGYPLYQLGLFTLGTCPGGGNSNLWALLLGADVNLSVTMTFVSTLAAVGGCRISSSSHAQHNVCFPGNKGHHGPLPIPI